MGDDESRQPDHLAQPQGGLGLMFLAAAIALFTVLFIVGAIGYALMR
jgi:hypothetical protein